MEKRQERIWYLEYLRIIATVAVVVLHVAAQNWRVVKVDSFEWKVFNGVDGAVRWCVPLFLMISGALFLDNKKELSIEKLYKKYILRLVIAFVFWSAVYAVGTFWNGADLKETITAFIKGPDHFWFLFMIVGLYVITPFLRKITESEKLTEYFLLITFIMTVFLPRITALIRILKIPYTKTLLECYNAITSDMAFHFTLGYVGYYVLGYYLNKKNIGALIHKICYALGAISIVATIGLTNWYSNKLGTASSFFFAHFGFCTLGATIGIFLFGKYKLAKCVPKGSMAVFLSKASKYSFGVYLTHLFVLEAFTKLFGISTLPGNPILCVIVLSVTVLVISYVISAVIHQIPYLKKYVV